MEILQFETREKWMEARLGKITGTRLDKIVVKRGTEKKIGFYELVAERLSVTEEDFDGYKPDETPMERGTRLQSQAVWRFCQETKKKVNENLVMWISKDNDKIAVSPDGIIIDDNGIFSGEEAIEVKCLSSARHIEAYLTNKVPDEYYMQILQYFCVNPQLQIVYMIFYDPRIPVKDLFYLTIKRTDVQEDVDKYIEYQIKTLEEVDQIVNKLSNF